MNLQRSRLMLRSSTEHHPQVITLTCCIRYLWFLLFGDGEREDSAGSLSPEREVVWIPTRMTHS